jgi:hypothetical protein
MKYFQFAVFLTTKGYTHKATIFSPYSSFVVVGSGILKSGIRDPRSGIRDPGFAIQDPRSANLDSRSGIRDRGSGIRDSRSEIPDARSEILDPRSGIRDPGSGIKIRIRDPGQTKIHIQIQNKAEPSFQCACASSTGDG